jgi:hypothetical protein
MRYKGGSTSLGNLGTDLSGGFFAWHGTAPKAVAPISDAGFDPKRRSGQVWGPGEYFGVNPKVSLTYCSQGSYMIVAFLLNGAHLKTVPGYCHVVDNPVDWVSAYCLPVLVVVFKGPGADPTPAPPFPPGPRVVTDGWDSPFRWHWKVRCQST